MMGQPGSALFGYYDVGVPSSIDIYGAGDNILTLINPAGVANFGLGVVTDKCAMIYVFDSNQEMGECCGCPLSPTKKESFSFDHDLLANWLGGQPSAGVVAIRAQDINNHGCDSFRDPGTIQAGCNYGCDPTVGPPSSLGNNFLGSIIHLQDDSGPFSPSSLTEQTLFNNGPGDATNNTYLIEECAELIGNSSGARICHCPSTSLDDSTAD